jgi:mono/diheme cytochrome c family protein
MMKSKIVIAAILACFAGGFCLESLANEAGADDTQSVVKKPRVKRVAKKRKPPVEATGAAAATGNSAAPPNATPAPTTTAPAPAAAKPAGEEGEGKVVKTDLYTVVDGFKVDKFTMDGFRTWRSAACDRCHGANQEGMVGPSLIDRLKILTKDEFKTTVLNGRLEKGMPSFNTSERVVKYIDNLYAYLKGRSEGAIVKAKPIEMD